MFRYRIGVFLNFKPGFNKIVTNLASWSAVLTKTMASYRILEALVIALDEMNVFY